MAALGTVHVIVTGVGVVLVMCHVGSLRRRRGGAKQLGVGHVPTAVSDGPAAILDGVTQVESSPWVEYAQQELARSGRRTGGAREQVVELLGRQVCCLSAQEIHERLRGGDRTVGLASVYRALDALTRLKLVHRIDVDGTACYEPAAASGEHHHHAICGDCGRMSPFADPTLERLIDEVGLRLGYKLDAHDLVLRGRCPDCAAAA